MVKKMCGDTPKAEELEIGEDDTYRTTNTAFLSLQACRPARRARYARK
jgi:hypothetical protein